MYMYKFRDRSKCTVFIDLLPPQTVQEMLIVVTNTFQQKQVGYDMFNRTETSDSSTSVQLVRLGIY